MAHDVAAEMNVDDSVSRDMSQFTADSVAKMTADYCADAAAMATDCMSEADPVEALATMFDARESVAPKQMADRMMSGGADAAALEMLRRSGAQAVQLHARGDCPECAAMDGQTMTMERAQHSPLHAGCVDCTITAA